MATDPQSEPIFSTLRTVGQHLGQIADALSDLSKAMVEKADGDSKKRVGIFKRLGTKKKAAIAILGTLVTLWVVPLLTRQAQDRSDARDIKAGLADDMSSAVGTFEAVAILRAYNLDQLYASGQGLRFKSGELVKPKPHLILQRAELNAAYATWVREVGSLKARLAAEFEKDPGLAEAWAAFAFAFTDFYFITENTRNKTGIADNTSSLKHDVKDFNQWADSLPNPLRHVTLSAKDISTLDRGQSTKATIDPFYVSYLNVDSAFDSALSDLVKHILNGHPTGLSTRPCDFWSTLFALEPGTLCRSG